MTGVPSQRYRQPEAGAVVTALHEIAARRGFLPEDELRRLARDLNVPLTLIYGAATFYATFTFTPPGRHRLQVCEGTACYVRGAAAITAYLAVRLGIVPDQTTADRLFTLKQVHCVGSCSLAPVVRVNGETFGRVSLRELDEILARYRAESQVE